MHYGRIDRNTMAGAVYEFLGDPRGRWRTTMEICTHCYCPSPSTRISEVRAQLGPEERIEVLQDGKVWKYRLVKVRKGK